MSKRNLLYNNATRILYRDCEFNVNEIPEAEQVAHSEAMQYTYDDGIYRETERNSAEITILQGGIKWRLERLKQLKKKGK